MKTKKAIILMLASILLLSSIIYGCGSIPKVAKPTIGTVPQRWYCSDDQPYGTYEETDGTKWGLITYTDNTDYDFVQIYYGDIPSELKGRKDNRAALIARATLEATTFDPDETGTMTVAGQLAGYAKGYNATLDVYDMEIVFVKGSTCVDIYAYYNATYEDEAQVISLINSIDLREQ